VVEDRIDYFERMLADNPDNPTGLLALANEYDKAERYDDEAAVLERYVATHERERTLRQHHADKVPRPADRGSLRDRNSVGRYAFAAYSLVELILSRKGHLVNEVRDRVSLLQEAERVILEPALALRDESVARRTNRVTTPTTALQGAARKRRHRGVRFEVRSQLGLHSRLISRPSPQPRSS